MCFSTGDAVAKRDGVTTRIVSGHQDAEGTVGNCNWAKKCLGARQQLVKLAPRSNQEFYVSDSLGWHALRSFQVQNSVPDNIRPDFLGGHTARNLDGIQSGMVAAEQEPASAYALLDDP